MANAPTIQLDTRLNMSRRMELSSECTNAANRQGRRLGWRRWLFAILERVAVERLGLVSISIEPLVTL